MHRDPQCMLCGLHKTTEYVCLLGNGPSPCEVMIVGEAPGREEELEGIPFIGKSGDILDLMLEYIGLDRDEVFVTNAVACRPPENRTPKKGEINACKTWLQYQMALVQPKYVLLLGNVPLESVAGHKGITKHRGKPFEKNGVVYVPTFHPSAMLHDPSKEYHIRKDFNLFKEIIEFGGIPYERNIDYRIIETSDDFRDFMDALTGTASNDLETTGLYPWADDAAIVSYGWGTRNKQWILPGSWHPESRWSRDDIEEMVTEAYDQFDDCFTVFQNGKFDALWTWVHHGIKVRVDFDTMLAHYLLDENSLHGLDHLSQQYYGAPDYDIPVKEKQGNAPIKKIAFYQAHDLYYTRDLRFTLGKRLREDHRVNRVFKKVMMPCVDMFIDVEKRGVYIVEDRMNLVEKRLRSDLADAEKKLRKYGNINWRSTPQLGRLFFDKLGIKPLDKTAKGANSTSESVLKRLDHPAANSLLKYRAADKQLSSFIDGWRPYIVNGRLHPSFKLHGTVTGRLSCEHPNLQQVPRDPVIRSLIHAPEGWELIEADLSQIELRIAAELADEKQMLYAFNHNIDVHWLTCMTEISRGGGMAELIIDTAYLWEQKKLSYGDAVELLLKVGPEKAAELDSDWKELRKKAKAVNFGYLYGMWWKKFKIYARDNYDVIVSDKQAQESRESFFETYGDLPKWHKKQGDYARRNGFVRSLSGRKRRLPAARSAYDSPKRREAIRQAINSPVQSFANEINLMAGLQMREEFSRRHLHIVGTVHDSLLMETRKTHVVPVVRRVLEIMKRPALFDDFNVDLKVPIEGEAKIGPWGKGVSLEKWMEANDPFV